MDSEEQGRRSVGARRNMRSADAILEAAEAVLLENGYGGFSIEAVARRARAGKPTIYRWWPNKAALLLDVYHRQKRHAGQADTGDLERDIETFLCDLLRLWRDTTLGSIFRSMVAEAQSDAGAQAALADYMSDRRRHTGAIVERAKARGEVAEDISSDLVADLLASFAWGRLLTNRLDDGEDMKNAARILADGIRKRS